MTKAIQKGYITERQAARILGRSVKWFQVDRSNANHGGELKIPFTKDGRKVFYQREDVVNYKEHLSTKQSKKPDEDKSAFFQFVPFEELVRSHLALIQRQLHGIEHRIDELREERNQSLLSRLLG